MWESESCLRNCLHETDLWSCLWSIFLMAYCQMKVQATTGSATSGRVALGSIGKRAEYAMGSQPASSIAVWVLLRFLLPGS